MRKKWLLSQPACEPPEDETGVVCKSQILCPDENDPFTWILNVDVFNFGALRARYFADKYRDEYAAYVKGTWRQTNLLNTIDIVKTGSLDMTKANGYYRYNDTEDGYYDTEADSEIANSYTGHGVSWWETRINADKRDKAWQRRVDRVNDLMAQVPPAPEDMEPWIRGKAFTEEYLMAKKEDGKRSAFCTACGKTWETEQKYRLGKTVSCPHCGRPVRVKGHANFSKAVEVILLQPFLGNWIERFFRAEIFYEFGKEPQLELFEDIRIVIPAGRTWGKCYYGRFSQADEFMQDWWDSNEKNKRFKKGFLYTNNLESLRGIAPKSFFRSGIQELAARGQFDVNKFIYSFTRRPYMEYLIKGRFYQVVEDILDNYTWAGFGANSVETPRCMNPTAEKITDLLNMDKNHVNRLRVRNGGLLTLRWLQYDATEEKVSDAALDFLESADLSVDNLSGLIEDVGSVTKVVNYIKKQEVSPAKFLTEWKDYLRMAQAEGYDTSDSIVRFPKDLKRRHDELAAVISERQHQRELMARAEKNKEINSRIVKHLPKTKRLFWENENYMIIPAGTVEELEQEGRTLHHCVGSSPVYKERMAEGTSWILFLRKKENLEKPYYTIEIDMLEDKIIQYYSEFDRQPDKKEIDKLLTEYRNYLKKNKPKKVVEMKPAALAEAM